MIRTTGLVFLLSLSFIASFSMMNTSHAGIFGTIESVDTLKEVAANQMKKKDNRAIASDEKKSSETENSDSSQQTPSKK